MNGGARTLIARNGYNEIGQPIIKKLGSTDDGTSFGQTVSYAYNERGWTKEIVSPLFKQYLKYNEGTAPQYNGNISSQEFTRFDLTQPTPLPATDNYSYTYDHLDRLTEGTMVNGKGRETLSYDRMGNIETLVRTGINSTVVDQLVYSYIGNRLMGVSDVVSGAAPDLPYHLGGSTGYTYDGNGNMKTRINAVNTGNNITAISYNHLNLPNSVTAAGGNVTYVYDASGRKLRSTNGIQGQTRDYIDGIEYVDGSIELIYHGEGRILNTGSSYLFEYYLKDHLGNNRSGFGAGVNVTKPDFSSDYYPFGMQYQQYVRAGNPKNNYLYNGKELQDGLKLYDYGARLYDPAIGRWGTIDPLAEQYGNVSGYNYALNNPMKFIDPDGRSVFTSSNLGDIENLLNQAKMLDAMSGGDDEEEDQDDPKKKKSNINWKALGQEFVDGTPLLGSGLRGAAKLNEGKYLDAAVEYGTFAAELFTGGLSLRITIVSRNLLNRFVENAAKGVSVIGPRATYREFAKNIGANFLDVTDEAWTMRKNVEFLQGVVKRGDDVIFSGKYNPLKLDPNSVLGQEIRYLQRHGYSWTDDFSRMIKK